MMDKNAAHNNSASTTPPTSLMTSGSAVGFLLFMALLFIGLELAGAGWRETLRYERNGLESGQWWRLIGGHFVHLGAGHVAMNLAGLTVTMWVFADNTARDGALKLWWLPTLLAAPMISVVFIWFAPSLSWYVGFSGVLHTLVVVALWRGKPYWPAVNWWLLSAAVAVKLSYEASFGALPGSAETAGGPVAVQAHIAGAAFGLLYCALWWLAIFCNQAASSNSNTQ